MDNPFFSYGIRRVLESMKKGEVCTGVISRYIVKNKDEELKQLVTNTENADIECHI